MNAVSEGRDRPMIFRVNDRLIDIGTYEVRRDGQVVPVEPQVFDLLVLLIENRDRLVTKDEIVDRIWHGRAVSEAALNSRIKSARQAIGDNGSAQELIRTIRQRGFRFVGPVGQWTSADTGDLKTAGAPNGSRYAPTMSLNMPAGPGVGIMPFSSACNSADENFFCNAIADEIATQLTRFSELRVITRTTTSERNANAANAADLGRELGLDFLVTGHLRQASDRIRVTANLIRTVDSNLLWADTYERCLTAAQIFAIEDDITSKVVAAIASISAGAIARETLARGRRKAPRELDAYESVVRVNELMQSGFSAATHLVSRTSLEATVAKEPDYAPAWALLAWVHTLEYAYGYNKRAAADPR